MRSVRALTVGLLLSSVVLVVAFVVPADAAVKKTSSLTVKVSGAPKRYPAMITVSAKNFVRQLTKTATLKNLTPGTYTLKASAIYSPTGKWVSKPPRKVSVKAGASAVVVVSYQKVASVGSLTVTLKASPQGKPVKVTVTGPKGFKNTLTKSSVINGLQPGQYSVTGSDIDLKENLTAIAVSSDPTPMVLAGEKSKVVVSWNSRQASNLVVPPEGSLVSQKVIAGLGEFETSAVKAYRIGDPVLLPATETERERVVIVSSISGNTVSVTPGSVYDALPVVDFKYTSALSPELQQNVFSAQVTAQGEREFTFFGTKIKAEWGCEDASKPVEINMKTTYTPILKVVDAKLNWNVKSRDIILGPSAAKAVIRTGVTREMSLEISSKLSVECRATLSTSVLAFTLGPIPFYVRGSIGLVSSIESSPLTVEVGQTDTFSVDWGVDYSRGSALKPIWQPFKDSDMSIDKLGTWSLDAKVEGKAGLEVEIELSPFKEPFEWKAEGCQDLKFTEVCQTFFKTSADLAIGVRGEIGVGLRMTPKKDQVVGGSVATFGFQKFWYASVSAYLKAEASLTVGVTIPFAIDPSIKIYDKNFEPIGSEYFRTFTVNGGSMPIGGSPTTTTVSPGTTTTTIAPVTTTTVLPSIGARYLSLGNQHSCLTTAQGTVKCWGRSSPLSAGIWTPFDLTPNVVQTASGETHACILLSTGTVQCTGSNNAHGQLGNGTTSRSYAPTEVVGLTGVTQIVAYHDNTCALLGSGSVKCWGENSYGQIGDGTTTDRSVPTQVTGLTSGVVQISTSIDNSCAVLSSGVVKCWGRNRFGQIGDGTTTDRYTPTQVTGLSFGATQVTAEGSYACAVLTNGSVSCWGYNSFGNLGDGTTTNRYIPTQVLGLTSGVSQIIARSYTACALLTSGSVKCWGYNSDGQIGDGTTTDRYAPKQVTGLTSGVERISVGGFFACALLTAGLVKCWGDNTFGKLGDGSTTDRYTPVDVLGL